MYRAVKIRILVSDDSNGEAPIFGPRDVTCYQTRDLEEFHTTVRVGPSDAEAQIAIAPIATGYFLGLLTDYPVRCRFNSASGTQFIMTPSNVAATNVGAPLPDQCAAILPFQITGVWLQPIASAAQTANVKIVITGDPSSVY